VPLIMQAKHSVLVAGHATSITLEPEFWDALKEIAAAEGRSLNALVEEVDREREGNLSSALRLFVLRRLKAGNPQRPTS
jgi:predicted DNA-binding ribbon-helix-helix protein